MARGRQAAEKYATSMQNAGWVLKREIKQRRGGEFTFIKDTIQKALVKIAPGSSFQQGSKKNHIFIKIELKRLIPLKDVPGYDYPDVPRYPGSIRVRWMDLLGDYAVKYLTTAPLEKVKSFYQAECMKLGWKESRGPGILNYQKSPKNTDRKIWSLKKKAAI
jgi:hypothetical protein